MNNRRQHMVNTNLKIINFRFFWCQRKSELNLSFSIFPLKNVFVCYSSVSLRCVQFFKKKNEFLACFAFQGCLSWESWNISIKEVVTCNLFSVGVYPSHLAVSYIFHLSKIDTRSECSNKISFSETESNKQG